MLSQPAKLAEITEGTNLSIALDVATAHCAVGHTSISGTVTGMTEKAVKITTTETQRDVWFPKKALVKLSKIDNHIMARKAHWFRASDWHYRNATSGFIAA